MVVALQADHQQPGGFFSLWGLQAMVIAAALGPAQLRQWLQRQVVTEAELGVVKPLHSAHHLGIHASRAWGFWAAHLATGEGKWRRAHARATFGR